MAATAAALLFVTGCGGDDDSDSATLTIENPPTTRQQFIRQANRICLTDRHNGEEEYLRYLNDNKVNLGSLQSVETHAVQLTGILLGSYQKQIEDLKVLIDSTDVVGQIEPALTALEVEVEEGLANPQRWILGDGFFSKATKIARANGFEHCPSTVD